MSVAMKFLNTHTRRQAFGKKAQFEGEGVALAIACKWCHSRESRTRWLPRWQAIRKNQAGKGKEGTKGTRKREYRANILLFENSKSY